MVYLRKFEKHMYVDISYMDLVSIDGIVWLQDFNGENHRILRDTVFFGAPRLLGPQNHEK